MGEKTGKSSEELRLELLEVRSTIRNMVGITKELHDTWLVQANKLQNLVEYQRSLELQLAEVESRIVRLGPSQSGKKGGGEKVEDPTKLLAKHMENLSQEDKAEFIRNLLGN